MPESNKKAANNSKADTLKIVEPPKSARVNRGFPVHSLSDALVICQAIAEMNAGKPMDRLLVAKAVGRKPSSSEFKLLLSSSYKYGLTEGTEKSDNISLTSLGQKITKPTNQQEKLDAIKQAVLAPELISRILIHYNRNKLPQGSFFHNALERIFGVPTQHTEELAKLLLVNTRFAGLIEDLSGSEYIRMNITGSTVSEHQDASDPPEGSNQSDASEPAPTNSAAQTLSASSSVGQEARQIFVAHGKNRVPMEQLTKILNEFKIPFKVAVNEANAGRPISQKIAETMRASSAAIFVFTKDEEFTDKDGNTVWRPSENIIYELGAASLLYGNKIIDHRTLSVSDFV